MDDLAGRRLPQMVVDNGARVDLEIAQIPQGQLSTDLDIQWLLNSAYFVFFMQVRSKMYPRQQTGGVFCVLIHLSPFLNPSFCGAVWVRLARGRQCEVEEHEEYPVEGARGILLGSEA